VRRTILRLGDPVIRQASVPVPALTPEIDALVDDMIETMHAAPGVGLAAPQVGVAQRLFVVDLSCGRRARDLIVVINPEVVERSGIQLEEEGCLSVPGFNQTVARPARMVVRGLDRAGRQQVLEGTGLLARAFQHEIDHLDGRVFVDRLPGFPRRALLRRIERLRRAGRW
jgi:peptide deformylase